MSTYTKNLNLFKYDVTADEKVPFSITDALNNNWDIIDEKCKGGSGLEICDIGMALYIDETKGLRRYLNGQVVERNTNTEEFFTRLQKITTLHPSLLDTEENWQAAKTLSAFGQVGKFVFNYSGDNIVSVRIPAIVNVQGLFDLQNLGMTVSAGLPTHTHTRGTMEISGSWYAGDHGIGASGAFYVSGGANGPTGNYQWRDLISFKASRNWTGSTSAPDNSVYGASNTVQQEAIQYPYFIQIATGSETENNIINEIELNNPYSLFDSKYSDHELNNLSWLKSEGQWNSKSVYLDAYDKLLKVYNGTETVEGLSVKLSTEEHTDYDFVLNTAEETFRLPLLNGSEDLVDYDSSTTYTAEFIAPSNGYLISRSNTNGYGTVHLKQDGHIISSVHNNTAAENILVISEGFCSKDGVITKEGQNNWGNIVFYPLKGNGSLYYYIGETVQNANLIDAGRIGEQLATKEDIDTWVYYQNGTSGYRYNRRNGYCEQWGLTGSGNKGTVNFVKTFANTNYTILLTTITTNDMFTNNPAITSKLTDKFSWNTYNGNNMHNWKASGYLASGQY